MTIGSVGFNTTVLGQSVRDIKSQLDTLQTQLTTGKKSTTYSGMGTNEGFAIGARSQLANIGAFTDTMTKVNTMISATNTALQSIVAIGKSVQTGAAAQTQSLGINGQSSAQQTASSQLSSMLGILNTQAGDRFLFSGAAIDTPSVASMADIMDGKGGAAGLKQVIAERKQADLGTSGLGRLAIAAPTATSVSLSEDVAGSPFGMKLAAVASTLTGATVSGPTGTPAAISVDLGATNPSAGDSVTFTFNMPDGTTEELTLAATTVSPPPAGSFTIGATSADTAVNLQASLTTSVGNLANTSLVAASALQASTNFFADPPQRVSGSPATATALIAGTATNTVKWYTGEAGTGSARASATARIDQSLTVQYGARANEDAIRNQIATIAAFAAMTTSSSDPNAGAQVAELSQRVTGALSTPSGQRVTDIQAEFANAQTVMSDAQGRQTQAKSMLQSIVDQAESISENEVATQLLALQTNLQASYQTTSMLAQLSLVKFL
jgi:flagellin-like hook-associated protein FlgL